jgi:hypothetical protein
MIGILLLVQLAGLIVPFILLHPLIRPPGFLENAAGSSFQIKMAVFLLFANGALTIGIAIAALPVFSQYRYRMALWLLALSVIWFSLQAVDNAHVLSMLSLSQEYAKAGAANADLFQGLGAVVGAARKWAHYTELLVIDGWMFVFYSLLWRSALAPRALTAFGLITVTLHTTGITLPLFLGYRSVMLMGVPLAVSHVAVALWLIVRGFDERHRPLHAEAPAVEVVRA